MVGQNAFQVINILKEYDGDQDKEATCQKLQEFVETELAKSGINGLERLTDAGMVGVLFYLYGIGMINHDFITTFANDPKRKDITYYKVGIVPAKEEDRLYMLSIQYIRESRQHNFNYNEEE